MINRSDQIASRKYILWIDRVLESLQDIDTSVADASRHELLAQFANPVMM